MIEASVTQRWPQVTADPSTKAQTKNESVEELSKQLSILREQKNELEAEAHGWMEKRDKLNDMMKRSRAEAEELRVERDRLNSEVKELKERRDDIRAEIHEKLKEISKVEDERRILAKKKPERSHQTLQREIEDIDWTIQTTPLTAQKDKELVGKVRQLETQLAVHRKIEQMTGKIGQFRADIKAMRTETEGLHKSLMEKAEKSQETHRRLMEKVEKSKALKKEADGMHQQLLLTREKITPVQREINAVLNRIRQLEGELRKEKQTSEDAVRETLQKRAEERLRRGEKLSWEEFQLLGEKETKEED
jgi:uncharacterized coiled-coil DUF342 family protein